MLVPRDKPVLFDPAGVYPVDLRPANAEPAAPSAGDVIGAAFRQENVVGSLLSHQWAGGERDPSYNPWNDIAGTPYEQHWEKFVEVGNKGQTDALKRQLDMETEDRNTLAAAGGWGVLASIGAGVFSPENLIPGGTIYRGLRMGSTVLRSAMSTASAAAISTAAAEVGLQATQELRTPTESAFAIGGSALLGGLLGAGLSAAFSKADFARLGKKLETETAGMFDMDGAALGAAVGDEMTKRLVAVGRSEAEAANEAVLYASFYGTMAKRTGRTVDELLEAAPLPEVRVGAEGSGVQLFQPAFHGSPHTFDRFSLSAIGTGEGNQAYGHGLYFASLKDVAETYRAALTKPAMDVIEDVVSKAGQPRVLKNEGDADFFARRLEKHPSTKPFARDQSVLNDMIAAWRGDASAWDRLRGRLPQDRVRVEVNGVEVQPADRGADPQSVAVRYLTSHRSKERALMMLDSAARTSPGRMRTVYEGAASWIRDTPNVEVKAPGRTYEVDIPDDHELLDWDAEFADLPAGMQEKVIAAGRSLLAKNPRYADQAATWRPAGDRAVRAIYSDLTLMAPSRMEGAAPRLASEALRAQGIPGHRYVGFESGTTNYVIYDDARVAVTRFEQDNRGSIEFSDPQAVIRLFETADRSTFLHETGHFFLQNYQALSQASPDLKADWDALAKYLDVGEDGRLTVEAHEKFARSFEAYLMEGKAPSAGLKAAFDQFRDWLLSVYRQITSLDAPINDDVRGIFDRMLASDAEIARLRDPQLANEDALIASMRSGGSVGAAAREITTIEENTIAGRAAQFAGGSVKFLNPVLRVLHSPSRQTRAIGTQLFENPVYLKKNMQGIASAPAVETLVKEYTQGAMARSMQQANQLYRDYTKAGGRLTRGEWNEAIGRAMRRGDEHEDKTIAAGAKAWRAAVFDPLKERAIRAGLLPADVSVDTALSYFTRVYNRPLIEAREPEFKGIVRRYIDKSIRDLEFKVDEIKVGNKIVAADRVNEKWRQAFDRLTGIDERLAGRAAVRRKKVADLNALQQLRFAAQKDRPPAELIKRLRKADDNAGMLDTLRELRAAERAASKPQKYHDKYPILARIKHRGGVKVGSFLDFELRNMGVNPQSHPGLFKSQGGLGAIDNWPWDDDTFFMDNFARQSDGYLDQNELLDAIRQEVAGAPLRTPEQIAEDEALDALASNVEAWLDEVGLPSNIGVGDARLFIKRMVGAEKAVDELSLRMNRMEREIEEFDEATENLANERTISEAETAQLQSDLDALEAEILEVRDLATTSPRVSIIVDYASVKRDLFKAKLDANRIERRVESLKIVRDEGRMNDALAAELAAKTTDLNKALDRVAKLTARADKLQPMVPKVHQELPEFLNEADRAGYVKQIVDDIFNTVTGRNVDGNVPRDIVAATRGPLKERTFHIPDVEIEEFLEHNVEAVARKYARTMASDIELTETFGKADLAEQIGSIRADYQRLREAVQQGFDPETGEVVAKELTPKQKEAQIKRLVDAEKNDVRDIEALRDMVRGAYRARENSSNYARVARVAGTINYLRTMGGVTISSMTDIGRHVMVHGFTNVMRDGLVPLIANFKSFKMSVQEAKLAGAVTERLLNTRMATWADITDPYSVSSPFERFMDNTATGFSKLNGMVLWNDFQKSFASVLTQNRVLRGASRYDQLGQKEAAYLAFLGIDRDMASRIHRQFETHGTLEAGDVRVANSDDWDDEIARRVYRAAVNKDVDSTIVTKGVGDVPLFAHTATGRLLLQFKSFALASHQRALMRGLQERQMGFLTGSMVAVTIGAMIYALKSIETNRQEDISDNPGRWIAEGIDRSGLLSIAFEVNNTVEKAFGIGGYGALAALFPNASQEGKASRYMSRGIAESLVGPTGALIDTVVAAGNTLRPNKDGRMEWTEGEINTIKRLLPGATLPGIRSLVEYAGVPAVKAAVGAN